jgi:hypothetical protein
MCKQFRPLFPAGSNNLGAARVSDLGVVKSNAKVQRMSESVSQKRPRIR